MFRRNPSISAVALAAVVFIFLFVFLLAVPAGALNASLTGRWVSLQYGSLTFTQTGNAFTAVWTGTNVAGSISGRQASFRFWAGASFDKCEDDSRGYGTLALSDDGNTLSGSWANASKKEPESGSFTAMRVSSISGQIIQDAAPEPEEALNTQTTGTEPERLDASSTADAGSQQAAAGSQTSTAQTPSATEPPDELILLPEDLTPEDVALIEETTSELMALFLKITGVFDDDSGNEPDAAPQPTGELILLPENVPEEYGSELIKFLEDIENGFIKLFDIFD